MAKSLRKKLLEKWQELLSIHKWIAYVLPLAVYMIIGSFEPIPPTSPESADNLVLGIPYLAYPWIYTLKFTATLFVLRMVWPAYKPLQKRFGWKGIAVGLVGGFLWIAVCNLEVERKFIFPRLEQWNLDTFLGKGTRSGFNPMKEFPSNWFAIIPYFIVRGLGLVVLVPVIEEFFLRGFLIRFVAAKKWWKYPVGQLTLYSAAIGTLVPMLMHPGEIIAAALWFTMITALSASSRNIWECIGAHASTNLVLGIYVLLTGSWHLI